MVAFGERPCPKCGGHGKVFDDRVQGFILRMEREAQGVTQKGLASQMGVSPQYLCDLEQGRREWNAALIEKYREGLKGMEKVQR
jgi:predicted transcriptional regulator